jgi:hypothetical protein
LAVSQLASAWVHSENVKPNAGYAPFAAPVFYVFYGLQLDQNALKWS